MTDQRIPYAAEFIVEQAAQRGAGHNERNVLDGAACLFCAQTSGAMIPVGRGTRGQVFAHPDCCERSEATS